MCVSESGQLEQTFYYYVTFFSAK